MVKNRVAVIGAGFSGISAAAYLAKQGHSVDVFEKNATAGGRARQFRTPGGLVFDMGPSWYWMPDVFEKFFADFNCKPSEFYELQLLDPAFEMIFKDSSLQVPSHFDKLCEIFEAIEKGAADRLMTFMKEAELKYKLAMGDLVYKPALSITEYMSTRIIRSGLHTDIFLSFRKHIRKYFSNPRLIALMEFPVLFLGAKPTNIPALYSLMNYAGLKLGTWYPKGGFGKVIEAMKSVAEQNGARFHFNADVNRIVTGNNRANALHINGSSFWIDGVIASADYHHVEQALLTRKFRNYESHYWNKKVFSPSALIFYLGLNKKLARLKHHTLFFDEDSDDHADEIYSNPKWPIRPLFYVCCPSRTDESVAPPGHENIFLLMPLAPGLYDDEQTREKYFMLMMGKLEKFIKEPILTNVVYKKSYCINDFINDYNAFKGNAYGLANTLSQTAILKPKIRNQKLKNLFYAGQLTVPGPGVPPSIISGKIAARLLNKYLQKRKDEVAV
jgi:phytoene desaturase